MPEGIFWNTFRNFLRKKIQAKKVEVLSDHPIYSPNSQFLSPHLPRLNKPPSLRNYTFWYCTSLTSYLLGYSLSRSFPGSSFIFYPWNSIIIVLTPSLSFPLLPSLHVYLSVSLYVYTSVHTHTLSSSKILSTPITSNENLQMST